MNSTAPITALLAASALPAAVRDVAPVVVLVVVVVLLIPTFIGAGST